MQAADLQPVRSHGRIASGRSVCGDVFRKLRPGFSSPEPRVADESLPVPATTRFHLPPSIRGAAGPNRRPDTQFLVVALGPSRCVQEVQGHCGSPARPLVWQAGDERVRNGENWPEARSRRGAWLDPSLLTPAGASASLVDATQAKFIPTGGSALKADRGARRE